MFSDVCALAEDAAEVGYAERDEADRSADRYSTGYKEHDREKEQCLVHVAEFNFSLHVACKFLCSPYCSSETYCKENQREDDVSRCDTFHIEVCCSPKIILLEKVTVRSIRYNDGSKGSDEGSEKDTEGNQVLGTDSQGHKEAHCCTDQSTDEATDSE